MKASSPNPTPVTATGSPIPRWIVPVAASFLGYLLFLALPWEFLRHATLRAVAAVLGVAGIPHTVENLAIRSGGVVFEFTADCTYADWWLMAAPFLAAMAPGPSSAVRRLVAAAAAVFVFNVLRIALAIALRSGGTDWFRAHDAIDLLIWYPGLTLVVLLWLRRAHPARLTG